MRERGPLFADWACARPLTLVRCGFLFPEAYLKITMGELSLVPYMMFNPQIWLSIWNDQGLIQYFGAVHILIYRTPISRKDNHNMRKWYGHKMQLDETAILSFHHRAIWTIRSPPILPCYLSRTGPSLGIHQKIYSNHVEYI